MQSVPECAIMIPSSDSTHRANTRKRGVIMDFNKIKEMGLEYAEKGRNAAMDLAERGRTQAKIVSEQTKLARAQRQLGALVYSLAKGNEENQPLVDIDTTFAAHPEMALYIPLIGGTGGNVGTQSSAIIVQGLANSSLDAKDTFKQVAKEAVVAVINATIISLLVYIYNFIRFGATATVTYSVSISLFAVVMFASIFGTLVPMTLEKLKVDPAIATGPFISITNDIIGMMLYMGITVLLS